MWRRIDRWDSRAGFRVDRRIVAAYQRDPDGPVPKGGFRFLVALSALLMVLLVAAVAVGVWLIARGAGLPFILLGALLIGAAWLLRPRLGRLKNALRGVHIISPEQAPAIHALVERIAGETGAPVPDVVAFDYSWNAYAAVVGFRRTKVLVLGVRLLLALEPQHLVALIGHELGHFHHEDGHRRLLTQPALTAFGRLSAALRPPPGNAVDRGMTGMYALVFIAWQLVGGTVSLLLFAVHLALHILDSPIRRRTELRADAMAVRAGGSTAALGLVDLFPLLPELSGYVREHVPEDRRPDEHWRRMLTVARDREMASAPLRRQLSIRSGASLFTSHPTPGRRHQWISGLPQTAAAVVVGADEAARIERELIPYAAALHRRMKD
ncbi:MAG: M48 family metalloprotease [Actinoplanes sp.]